MQLTLDNCFNSHLDNLHPGLCGPVYVSQIWREEESMASYCDKYFGYDDFYVPKRSRNLIKATIECESPEILNSVLEQIKNGVPYNEKKTDEVTGLTYIGCFKDSFPVNGKNGQLCTVNNKMFVYCNGWDLVTECVEKVEKIERYKLKHKILFK